MTPVSLALARIAGPDQRHGTHVEVCWPCALSLKQRPGRRRRLRHTRGGTFRAHLCRTGRTRSACRRRAARGALHLWHDFFGVAALRPESRSQPEFIVPVVKRRRRSTRAGWRCAVA